MIRIITDTGSDITLAQAAQMDVEIVTLRAQFGDEPYEQLVDDEGFSRFYQMLESHKEMPTTSQPSPADYLALYAKAKAAGDDVIVVTLSSGLSGTFQAATIAAGMAEYDRIFIVDSKSAMTGQRMLVDYAVRLRAENRPASEIYAVVSEAAGRIVLFAALDTLKYLRKGGRIPKTAEIIGTVMGVKPMITVGKDGKPVMAGKARGSAGAIAAMVKHVAEHSNFDPVLPVYFGYTCDDTLCRNFRKLCVQRYKLDDVRTYPVGGTIGTHIGPGAFGITYLARKV